MASNGGIECGRYLGLPKHLTMRKIKDEQRYFDDSLVMPYPWYTGPCLEFLEGLDLEGKRIFEFGAGDSTLWYRAKGAIVYGVDNDHTYCHIGIEYKRFYPEYCEVIRNYITPFDIVIIDGEWRDECTEYALKAMAPGSLLIIDNYKQPSVQADWPKTEKLLEGKQITLFKEPDHADWVTAVIVV